MVILPLQIRSSWAVGTSPAKNAPQTPTLCGPQRPGDALCEQQSFGLGKNQLDVTWPASGKFYLCAQAQKRWLGHSQQRNGQRCRSGGRLNSSHWQIAPNGRLGLLAPENKLLHKIIVLIFMVSCFVCILLAGKNGDVVLPICFSVVIGLYACRFGMWFDARFVQMRSASHAYDPWDGSVCVPLFEEDGGHATRWQEESCVTQGCRQGE